MEFPKPTVENLLSLAKYGGKNRLKAAREIANLDPDVNIDKLVWLINELIKDEEDPVFSETGISLGKLIEEMNESKAEELIEKLLYSHKGKLLLNIVLSTTRARIDADIISEIIRRLLNDDSEDVRNGAISVLRNFIPIIGKREFNDMLYELANSEKQEIRCFVATVLLALEGIDDKTLEDIIIRMLDDESDEVRDCILDALDHGLLERIGRSKKSLCAILNKIISLGERYVSKFLDITKKYEDIHSYVKSALRESG